MSVLSEAHYCLATSCPQNMATKLPSYPIHESVRDLLHEDYQSFYNKYLLHVAPGHLQPIEVSRRGKGTLGSSPPLPVGRIEEFVFGRQQTKGPSIRVRCFTPNEATPGSGWPVMLYFHGGGWYVSLMLASTTGAWRHRQREQCLHTYVCPVEMRGDHRRVQVFDQKCTRATQLTIITRLAPEDPFPAAIEDAWESLIWTSSQGARLLNLDNTKIAVGGASAGANLAAAIANRSALATVPIKLRSQLLVVPVLDNTALPCNNPTYRLYEHTAALTAEKMLWYRNHYLPPDIDRCDPDVSPLFFLKGRNPSSNKSDPASTGRSAIPSALIILGGCDILLHEGELYGQLLRERGVRADVHIMPGMPHPLLALDAVLEAGRAAITLLCDELNRVFSST